MENFLRCYFVYDDKQLKSNFEETSTEYQVSTNICIDDIVSCFTT